MIILELCWKLLIDTLQYKHSYFAGNYFFFNYVFLRFGFSSFIPWMLLYCYKVSWLLLLFYSVDSSLRFIYSVCVFFSLFMFWCYTGFKLETIYFTHMYETNKKKRHTHNFSPLRSIRYSVTHISFLYMKIDCNSNFAHFMYQSPRCVFAPWNVMPKSACGVVVNVIVFRLWLVRWRCCCCCCC